MNKFKEYIDSIPVKDGSGHLHIANGVVQPFVLWGENKTLLWLEQIRGDDENYRMFLEQYRLPSNGNVKEQFSEDYNRRLLNTVAYNKPLPEQTLETIQNLHLIKSVPHPTLRVNALGIYELLKNRIIPAGEEGSVYFIKAAYEKLNLVTFFADSVGAAKKFMREYVKISDMEGIYKTAGLPSSLAHEFENY